MGPRGSGLGGGIKHKGNKNLPSQTKAGYTTIFEEKTGVIAVAWNPNVRVGGWAAAGLGNGLVRAEDWRLIGGVFKLGASGSTVTSAPGLVWSWGYYHGGIKIT